MSPTKKSKTQSRSRCDRKMVEEFDYSPLSPEFSKLSKPAQRALINNGILNPKSLAQIPIEVVMSFHGIGPSALPILKLALKKHALAFKRR